jgi:hypothetical protein
VRASEQSRRAERGIYFDAWYPLQHNYHPSLPPRRLRMIDHIESYRGTMLVWAAMGGGALSLPYLEEEAHGPVPPRFRMYGFVNDAEFMAECGRRGIDVFGVVFEHAWEFPAELNDAEDTVLSLNETRDVGTPAWLGMREFWDDRYPKLWRSREHYFPDGVRDADGNEVTDILEECAQRDIYGEPCHALWIECPDREHWNLMMDRNNPVWREYLKAVVRIQIDAGVQGVHFDESEVPITSLQYGGCFCETCMRGFRAYLAELSDAERPPELAGVDLSTFHYGSWLLEQGHDFKSNRESAPLFFDYLRFQRRNISRYFAELADYAREYAASVGRNIRISGNFFHLFDHYFALEPKVDVIVTEMRNTTDRQPSWYRYAAGFGGSKPVVVVENPYGGVVPELVEALEHGRGYDRFRRSLYEAAALGVNMSVPYGAWMGSVIEDAFYPPHDLAVEIQTFLADHEELFGRGPTLAEVAVVFSIESNYRALAAREVMADNRTNEMPEGEQPFGVVCDTLSAAVQPYDVVFFPEGELRPDEPERQDLRRYRTVILPSCSFLTPVQADLVEAFVDGGGHLVVLGDLGLNLDADRRERILAHPSTMTGDVASFSLASLDGAAQLRVTGGGPTDAATTLQAIDAGAALHLIRYDHDEDIDAVAPLDHLELELRVPFDVASCEVVDPHGTTKLSWEATGREVRLRLDAVPLYAIVVLRR